MYTAMCTRPTDRLPVEYQYQIMQVALHQSDGGRLGADQPQQRAPTCVWSELHRGSNKFEKKGGKVLRFQEGCDFFKRRGEETEGAS